uniref:Claudin n=1 Tax=Geotrypetes seraphini TaxID=260995 RepID=A0A6P8PJ66_GEOSA|nr:claudin-10-like isoform X2 [Geotrypetes seraphini]
MARMTCEILAFVLTISGWVLVCSTLPTDYWKVSTIDGTVITTATFWSNLWKTCVTDSTGVSNCKDFPSMLALDGLCAMSGVSLYAHRITSEFFDPTFLEQKYELGAALFIGWGGSSLCLTGGAAFCFSMMEERRSPSKILNGLIRIQLNAFCTCVFHASKQSISTSLRIHPLSMTMLKRVGSPWSKTGNQSGQQFNQPLAWHPVCLSRKLIRAGTVSFVTLYSALERTNSRSAEL